MLAHLEAMEAVVASLGYATYRVRADGPTLPAQYVIFGSASDGLGDEPSLCLAGADLDVDVRVTAVAPTTDGVLIMLPRLHAALAPGRIPAALSVSGRSAWLRWLRAEVVDVDTSITDPATNLHPAFGVDTYHLTSLEA